MWLLPRLRLVPGSDESSRSESEWSDRMVEPELEFDEAGVELEAQLDGTTNKSYRLSL